MSGDQALGVGQRGPSALAELVAELSTELAIAPARARGAAAQATRLERRARGVVYTPMPLVEAVVTATLGPWAGRPLAELAVLDPACGDGRFLVEVARWARRHRPGARLRLVGIDRDPEAAEAARRALETAAPGAGEVLEAEALLGAELAGPFDAVVGNPPYVRSVHLRAHEPELWRALRGRFVATSHGEWDLYAAFLERARAWVRPGGRVGLLVPSRWLTAAFAAPLRAALGAEVEAVIDFGAEQLFPDATTYSSIVLLEAGRAEAPSALLRRTAHGFDESVLPRGAAPWISRATTAQRHGRHTLGQLAQVAKGCGTNADKVYVLSGQVHGDLFIGHDGRGQPVQLEAELVRPCLRGRDVREPDTAVRPGPSCLLPYDAPPGEQPRLVPWPELVRRAPRAAAYLENHRAELERRERGRFAGEAFHCFGRPQNLAFLLDPAPKIVIPDVTLEGRAVFDRGSLVLDSAYALRPRPDAPAPWQSLPLWIALLRSGAVRAWLEQVGVHLRGGYVRMKTAFLAPMPLPPEGDELARAHELAERGDLPAASAWLQQAYGSSQQPGQREAEHTALSIP